jgi:hypothetical protein
MRSQEKYHRLRLTLKNEVYPDVLRFKVECIDYYKKYKDTKHRNRIRAIAQAERGLKK